MYKNQNEHIKKYYQHCWHLSKKKKLYSFYKGRHTQYDFTYMIFTYM